MPVRHQLKPGGLVIALLGFFLTRYTVTFALTDTPFSFVVGGVTPLVLGLSLSAFGVALAVGSLERWYVRTVALWTLLGGGTIGLLVLATIYGDPRNPFEATRAVGAFSNILIGGSVGGALTGVYAAQNRSSQRELLNRQNRLIILNRLLHDKVMNAVTVIKGAAPLLEDEESSEINSVEAILEKATSIEEVMSSIRDLAEPGPDAEPKPVGVSEVIDTALEHARERHPDASFVRREVPSGVSVYANHRLADVLYQLVVNGVEHADVENPRVTVAVDVQDEAVTLSVADEGPGLPERNRKALEDGTTIANQGDPTTGLGLYLVRLFVRAFRGSIDTHVTEQGTNVSLTLTRVRESTPNGRPSRPDESVVGIVPERLAAVGLVALFAGFVMGAYVHLTTGSIPIIGALYGAENGFIGVLTHEFHSVVFGFIYAALLMWTPNRYTRTWMGRVTVAVFWGIGLWLVASGIIMPLWLNLVGIEASVPDLSAHSLGAHVIWGLVLGAGDHLSQRWELAERLRRRRRNP